MLLSVRADVTIRQLCQVDVGIFNDSSPGVESVATPSGRQCTLSRQVSAIRPFLTSRTRATFFVSISAYLCLVSP